MNREISWLAFNHRVLQEAKDPSVPLYEKIKFVAIYSSNLDEFFRVRVASVRTLMTLNKKTIKELGFDPKELLRSIHKIIKSQQEEIGEIFRDIIKPELKKNKIHLIDETQLNLDQKEFVSNYFENQIQQYIQPVLLVKDKINPFLQNARLYLSVKLAPKDSEVPEPAKVIRHKYAILKIPTDHLPRFLTLPAVDGNYYYLMIDDALRYCLPKIFPGYKIASSHALKLTRDAELYIDDEYSGDLMEKLKHSLAKRNVGQPIRLLYDKEIPTSMLKFIRESVSLDRDDCIGGGKYHNFSDFFSFPNPFKNKFLYENMPPLPHPELEKVKITLDTFSKKEYLIHVPFQKYQYVIDFLDAAAEDENVVSIKVTQYRVAKRSAVIRTLKKAAANGKHVIVFVEVKARFDEESNFKWAAEMEKSGIKVLYSFPGLKVHSKLALVTRIENEKIKNYCYFGTGNFNESTAKLYTDLGFITSDKRLTTEASKVFDYLEGTLKDYKFKHLLVAQFNMRKKFCHLIQNEIEAAKKNKKARILAKMNSLEDPKMISRLYEASNAGVKIDLIVRGLCCLEPGVKGKSENINVISIVDRYLEHSRIFVFENGGDKIVFAGSADWMKRNLNRRIEVIFPIYDTNLKKEVIDILKIQLKDNTKARIINKTNKNKYKVLKDSNPYNSQIETYKYYKEKNKL
ncbi:MAG: polyphosphate kinase 1 [Melioribacteraceae bacterium]|nr:polyphosphate kinase 1 [Melioribacteraceae bacterium]